MIKLKQLKQIDAECSFNESINQSQLSSTSFSMRNESFLSATMASNSLIANRSSLSPLANNKQQSATKSQFYFDFFEPVIPNNLKMKDQESEDDYDLCDKLDSLTENFEKQESQSTNIENSQNDDNLNSDTTVQCGLLNLILDCVSISNYSNECDDEQQLENFSIRLREAISLFNLMNQYVDDENCHLQSNYYHLNVNKLNFNF
jgi:hypothetical protein